jgi:hypothetical protein
MKSPGGRSVEHDHELGLACPAARSCARAVCASSQGLGDVHTQPAAVGEFGDGFQLGAVGSMSM